VTNVENKVIIYPNPAKQSFTVESLDHDISEVAIYNLCGKLVYQSNVQMRQLIIKEPLKSGVYFVRIMGLNTSVFTQKLVIN